MSNKAMLKIVEIIREAVEDDRITEKQLPDGEYQTVVDLLEEIEIEED